MTPRERLVRQLRRGGIADERVLTAIGKRAARAVRPGRAPLAGLRRRPLPIGHGATISQPTMVARLCEELLLTGTERVLDVGTGSGYQAAVLAELAADVVGIERIPALAEQARSALVEAGCPDVEVHVGDGTLGLPERAPFDAIAVAAAAPRAPAALVAQLAPGGRLVVPVGSRRDQRLEVIIRTEQGAEVVRSVLCRFVPLVGEEGFDEPPSGQTSSS